MTDHRQKQTVFKLAYCKIDVTKITDEDIQYCLDLSNRLYAQMGDHDPFIVRKMFQLHFPEYLI